MFAVQVQRYLQYLWDCPGWVGKVCDVWRFVVQVQRYLQNLWDCPGWVGKGCDVWRCGVWCAGAEIPAVPVGLPGAGGQGV